MKNNNGAKIYIMLYLFINIFVVAFFLVLGLVHDKIESEVHNYGKSNPFTISSAEEFLSFVEMVNSGYSFKDEYVVLTNDIDFYGIEVPIMGDYERGHYFEGTFDGNGHCIYNINRKVDEGDNSLFGTLEGTVMNLGIESGELVGDRCGGIASRSFNNTGRILNCYNKASLIGISTGGIACKFDDKIVNCLSMCHMSATQDRGNIICFGDGMVINCFSVCDTERIDTYERAYDFYSNFFVDEKKYSSVSQFVPIICDELNNNIYNINKEFLDIPVSDYNTWEVSADGQTLFFSEKKATSHIGDKIRYGLLKLYPYSTIAISMLVVINTLVFTGGVGEICFENKSKK